MGAVVGPVPKSYTTWMIKWQNKSRIGPTGRAHPRPWMDSAQSDSYLDSWEVGSLKGLSPEYNGKQLTALDPDRTFNAILSRDSSHKRRRKPGYIGTGEIAVISARELWKKSGGKRWPPPPLRPCLEFRVLWNSKDTWTVGEYSISSSETRGWLIRNRSNMWHFSSSSKFSRRCSSLQNIIVLLFISLESNFTVTSLDSRARVSNSKLQSPVLKVYCRKREINREDHHPYTFIENITQKSWRSLLP
ncbi:hypothetical protein PanWU01x14_220420 [Parasponia andersonii]|uniref:Uncharacterized protein n=1 Tax=Parasponia andersonii TaxID=3476 RepID=A0A2P5BQ62_PARAD|nr:hypothetical protein PanWU01x14_220420 [Parasponia andersonii]